MALRPLGRVKFLKHIATEDMQFKFAANVTRAYSQPTINDSSYEFGKRPARYPEEASHITTQIGVSPASAAGLARDCRVAVRHP